MRSRNRSIRGTLVLAAIPVILMAGVASAEYVEVRSIQQDLAPGDASGIDFSLWIGDLTIEGTDGPNVEVELALDCNRQDMDKCKARADRVRLAPRMKRGELKVRLKRTPRARLRGIKARMKVRMPRHLPIEVDLTRGDVYVSGLTSRININSGGGDVDVLGERDHIRHVDVDVGFGSANLWLAESRVKGTGWPKKINWKGPGDKKIEIDVIGDGDVSVRLE